MEAMEEGERQKSEMLVKGSPYQPVGSEHRVVGISLSSYFPMSLHKWKLRGSNHWSCLPRTTFCRKGKGSSCSCTVGLHIQSPQPLRFYCLRGCQDLESFARSRDWSNLDHGLG